MNKIFTAAVALLMLTACNSTRENATNETENENETILTDSECDFTDDMAPDFTLTTIDGGTLSLSDLRGKYVVLDFWGSWCGWCIKGMPEMKEYYAKYSDKLEIVGVDYGDSDEEWRDAVNSLELGWRHVKADDDVIQAYSIEGFPTKVIVGTNGAIINTFVGETPEFYETLDTLLQ